jgi:murein DD-endopeptidase MepM/ murein hydrolase activator NlpD
MAIKSSINTANINRSVGSFRQSLNNAQKSAGRVNSSILQRNKFKKESISKKNSLFLQRRSAVRRKESQDASEATTALGIRRAPSRITSGSTRSFFGRMMDISGALMAGWLVTNLPNIINLAEATSRRAVEVARVLGGAINSFTQILNTLFTGLTTIGASLLRGDIASIPNKLSKSVEDMQTSFTRMFLQLEDAYKVLTQPLDFSKDIEELRERLGLEVPGEEPGPGGERSPGGGGQLQPIHRQALDIIAKPESGGNYNSMNQGTDSNGKIVGSGDSNKIIGKALTSMTIGEVMERQDERKYPRNARPDRGIHAAGKYQIVGNTLPSAMKGAGLSPSDMFSPENQDLLGLAVLRDKGIGAWTVGGSKYSAKDRAIIEQARRTPLGAPTATVQPGTRFRKDQDITSIVGAKGTPSVIVTSLRGNRVRNGRSQWHGGIDIATDNGVYIALRANCVVLYAGDRGGYGLLVDVWVESYGIKLRMAHCSSILPNCKAGAVIPAGVSFARVGSTGESTGPHIHFETDTNKNGTMNGGRDYGGNTDPSPYVSLLLLTSRQSNGFKGVTSTTGKPLAQTTPTGTGGSPEVLQSLTPERKGQTVIVTQPQTQAAPPPPSAPASMMPMVVGDSLNSIHNSILLNQLAYT